MRRSTSVSSALALAAILSTPAGAENQASPSPYTYAAPPSLNDGWTIETLEKSGIDRKRLEAMTDSIRAHPELNVHAALIEHDGHLVYEEYFSGNDERWGAPLGKLVFSREMKHDLRSITKSVVSALIGIAVESGAIRSLDTPLLDYFPELTDLQATERRAITIRHALMMSAGFDWNERVPYNDPKNDEIVMIRSSNPIHYVLSRPIVAPPGTEWRYNGGTTQVLGTIVQRATKQPLASYADQVLFSGLGIADSEWLGDLAGVPSAASGLRLRPRDLAKFGSLYLNEGRWKGRQVIPSAWVQESTKRKMTFPQSASRGYAYQWWHTCYQTPSGVVEVPTAVGNGEQRIFLLRSQKTVVTFLSGRYNDFSASPPERLLLDFILPALAPAAQSTCPS
jgi:CubicO group peptidase (beta-lactamase class C family)